MSDQIEMLIDLSAYEESPKRKTRPARHYRQRKDERTVCGHLPVDGEYIQVPLSIKAFLAVTDCPVCHSTLKFIAAVRVVRRSLTPVSNTGVICVADSENGGQT